MVIRVKLFWKVFLPLICMAPWLDFSPGSQNFLDWLWLFIFSLAGLMALFMSQTARIEFSTNEMSIQWYIGVPGLKLYAYKGRHRWDEVTSVFQVLPDWFPLTMIGLMATIKSRNTVICYLGSLYTQSRASIVFVAEHVNDELLDDEVKKLVIEYHRETVS